MRLTRLLGIEGYCRKEEENVVGEDGSVVLLRHSGLAKGRKTGGKEEEDAVGRDEKIMARGISGMPDTVAKGSYLTVLSGGGNAIVGAKYRLQIISNIFMLAVNCEVHSYSFSFL